MVAIIPYHINLVHNTNTTADDTGNVNVAKGTAMVVLFIASLTLGVLPVKLSQWFHWKASARNNQYVKMLLGVGGGVLMCTTFLHLLPEVNENFEKLDLHIEVDLHLAELLMCTGFFIMYFVEECVDLYLHYKQHIKEEMRSIRRSLSIRRGDIHRPLEIKEQQTSYTGHNEEHNNHADHSHVIVDMSDNSAIAIIRGLLVVLALSVHELFEGLAVGLESSSSNVWYMFGAVSAHKLVIAFCIGVELVTSGLKTTIVIAYVFTFAVVSPMGIGIGIILSNSEGESSTDIASVFLQGLASGTLLYVVFFEILQADKKSGLKQYFAIFFGFAVMFSLTLLG